MRTCPKWLTKESRHNGERGTDATRMGPTQGGLQGHKEG